MENKKPSEAKPELLEVRRTAEQGKNSAVFSLLNADQRARGTFRVETSSLLSQVKQFLPKLQAANDTLTTTIERDPELRKTFDIEAVEDDAPFVEMNVAVYEESEGDSDEKEDDTESTSDTEMASGPVTEENIVIPGLSSKKLIAEISSKQTNMKGNE